MSHREQRNQAEEREDQVAQKENILPKDQGNVALVKYKYKYNVDIYISDNYQIHPS